MIHSVVGGRHLEVVSWLHGTQPETPGSRHLAVIHGLHGTF